MTRKKTKGRQKIEIKKIENDEDRMIAFSKRRSGIYKKMSELATLCGADIGFLAFSGAGNPFTFGFPSFESVADRFVKKGNLQDSSNSSSLHRVIVDAHKKVTINELNRQYSRLVDELEVEKERTKALASVMSPKESKEDEWWQIDPEEVEDEEVLRRLRGKYTEFHDHLCRLVIQRSKEGASTSSKQINFLGLVDDEASRVNGDK